MSRNPIRAYLFQEGELWVAQALEVDVAVQGVTRADVLHRLGTAVRAYFIAWIAGASALPEPAPAHFEELFKKAPSTRKLTLAVGVSVSISTDDKQLE